MLLTRNLHWYIYIINNMLFSLKILRSDWSKAILFFSSFYNEQNFYFAPPPSLWLACVTLLIAICDVTVPLFIDKTNVREVILFNKNSPILNQINYTQIFVVYYKKRKKIIIIIIDLNIFLVYRAIRAFMQFAIRFFVHSTIN